ncbi:MAG TPA: hypothetical protein DCM38_07215 [Gammaproteobacteria bacterium]|nr:hypothetical protein [Candidatus Parabeggiatoa sp.]HAI69208.1 hypothetical protein [Gammaproteobacteria bacterium]
MKSVKYSDEQSVYLAKLRFPNPLYSQSIFSFQKLSVFIELGRRHFQVRGINDAPVMTAKRGMRGVGNSHLDKQMSMTTHYE